MQSFHTSLRIYRASAGSGKTFALTKEFLLLALRNETAYRNILAITFTNKATREMKQRILGGLRNLSLGQSLDYQEELRTTLNMSDSEIQERATDVLRAILHDYGRFSVTTIDKFFQKVLRAFTREINVSNGYEVLLDQGPVLEDIARRVVQDIDSDPQLEEWITEFAETRMLDGKHWDFRKEIVAMGSTIFTEEFKKSYKRSDSIRTNIRQFASFLRALRDAYYHDIQNTAREALLIMDQHGVSVSDFFQGDRGPAGTLKKAAAQGILPVSFPNSYVLKALQNPEDWCSRSAPNREVAMQAVHAGLGNCLSRIYQIYSTSVEDVNTAEIILKNIYIFGIYSDLQDKLEEYRKENDVLMLADAVELLRGVIDDQDTPFVYEKVGTQFQHILIDEFQDTSEFQWDNLRPLIKNSMDEGKFNLLVGDVKQSIYRWRGGRSELLLSEVEAQTGVPQIIPLDTNWRSRKEIIGFNNRLFLELPELAVNTYQSLTPPAHCIAKSNLIKNEFLHAPQKWQGKKPGGYAEISFIARRSANEKKSFEGPDIINEFGPERARLFLSQIQDVQLRGYKPSDIVILVRSGLEGRKVADLLLESESTRPEKVSYAVVSDESGYLNRACSIRILLSALRWICHPEDTVNCGLLLASVSELRHHTVPMNDSDWNQNLRNLPGIPEEFTKNRMILRRKSIYDLCETIVRIFELHLHTPEVPYLNAFLDIVATQARNGNVSPEAFLAYWDDLPTPPSLRTSEKSDAMRIMTVHKSKGLEFEIVLIPFLHWSLDNQNNNTFWTLSSKPAFAVLGSLPVEYGKSLIKSAFSDAYYEEKLMFLSDCLNLAYVAFTRAVSEIYCVAEEPNFNQSGGYPLDRFSDLLYTKMKNGWMNQPSSNGSYLADLSGCVSEDLRTLTLGEKTTPESSEKSDENGTTSAADMFPVNAYEEYFRIGYQAGIETVRTGNLVHDALSMIQTAEDVDTVLQEMVLTGKMGEEEKKEVEKDIRKILDMEECRTWFAPGNRLLNERKLLIPDETGQISVRKPDRVVLYDTKTVVIDYKTGKPLESHRKQVLGYTNALAAAGLPNPEGWLIYTEEEAPVKVLA
jgi:ATP-dependent exoDNAse (exonuclease V) beta subunit